MHLGLSVHFIVPKRRFFTGVCLGAMVSPPPPGPTARILFNGDFEDSRQYLFDVIRRLKIQVEW